VGTFDEKKKKKKGGKSCATVPLRLIIEKLRFTLELWKLILELSQFGDSYFRATVTDS
jgi:hypothetical protein